LGKEKAFEEEQEAARQEEARRPLRAARQGREAAAPLY
jgi:hypothetical protein